MLIGDGRGQHRPRSDPRCPRTARSRRARRARTPPSAGPRDLLDRLTGRRGDPVAQPFAQLRDGHRVAPQAPPSFRVAPQAPLRPALVAPQRSAPVSTGRSAGSAPVVLVAWDSARAAGDSLSAISPSSYLSDSPVSNVHAAFSCRRSRRCRYCRRRRSRRPGMPSACIHRAEFPRCRPRCTRAGRSCRSTYAGSSPPAPAGRRAPSRRGAARCAARTVSAIGCGSALPAPGPRSATTTNCSDESSASNFTRPEWLPCSNTSGGKLVAPGPRTRR